MKRTMCIITVVLLGLCNSLVGGEVIASRSGSPLAILYPIEDKLLETRFCPITPSKGRNEDPYGFGEMLKSKNGLIVNVVNRMPKPFMFSTKHIKLEQGDKKWEPLYVLYAKNYETLLPAVLDLFYEGVKKAEVEQEIMCLSQGADLQNGTLSCYLALKDPVPNYNKPLQVYFGSDRVTITFNKTDIERPSLPE